MSNASETIGGIVAGIITLAVIALVLSKTANTANVMGSFFGGLSQLVGTAISPVTGAGGGGLGGLSNLTNSLTGLTNSFANLTTSMNPIASMGSMFQGL